MPVTITHENYEEQIENATKPVIIDVYADWCGPCQQMAPLFDELSQELSSNYIFAKLNVDESRDLAVKFGVTSIPTFIFMKNGEILGKETGYMSKEDLRAKIEESFGA